MKATVGRAPSLRAAATRLHEVAQAPSAQGWAQEAMPAVRGAIVAIEMELDALHARDTSGETLTESQPRLIHEAEALQAHLAQQLVALWEMKDSGRATQEAVEAVAERLAELARQSLDLTWEALRGADALD